MSTTVESSETTPIFADLFTQTLKAGGVARVLGAIRKYLGMDVAFVSRFREEDRILEHVDTREASFIRPGLAIPLKQGYCFKVAVGELPELIPDTASVPAAMAIPETRTLPIGSHLSVPIRLQNGDVYGTLCCFSHLADPTLGKRDLRMMHAFAEVLGAQIDDISSADALRAGKVAVVRRAMEDSSPQIVYQPIYRLHSGDLAGLECLSRFDPRDSHSPSQWFHLAEEVGLRQELELSAIARALATLDSFPSGIYFGLNSSPQTIVSGGLANTLNSIELGRIVVEITEHAIVADYKHLNQALQPLRERGLRVAIDDAGAGYASMRHIVSLRPDFIKLDMSLTSSIDKDPARRALARALTAFSQEIGSQIIAEGIETRGELDQLRDLGVETGQGFLLGRPVPFGEARQAATLHPELASLRAPERSAPSQALPCDS